MTIDTKKAERRPLRFESLDDVDAELDRLEIAHERGALRHTGNYTPAQTLHHLARWVERYETGDLPEKVPLPVRALGRLMRGRILSKGFPPGLPGPEGKTQAEPDTPFGDALAFLREKMDVTRAGDFSHANPMFGRVSHGDVVKIHLRHAELHLSFLHPGGPA